MEKINSVFDTDKSLMETSQNDMEMFSRPRDYEPLVQNLTLPPKRNFFCFLSLLNSVLMLLLVFDIISLSSTVSSDSYTLSGDPPAKRAIVFISDGTKSEAIYGFNSSGEPVAPFLRTIIKNTGSFGESFAGLPTETRSCMTVLLSGHYLEFEEMFELYFYQKTTKDHFLNESKWAWSFGNPEIITLFQSSRNYENLEIEPYNNVSWDHKYAESERVLEQFNNLFDRAKENSTLLSKLMDDKVVILVHIVGADTSGHTKGAQDPDYLDQIQFIDQGIKQAYEKIENFFGDNKTSYLLTADHGMRNYLRHTGDNASNIRIPFIAWGAGIMGPEAENTTGETYDDYSKGWGFEGIKKKDVRQNDLASLVSSLVGTPIPVHSEGKIPLDYLDSDYLRAEAGVLNAKQLCSQYRNREILWHDNSLIAQLYEFDSREAIKQIPFIEKSIKHHEYESAIDASNALITRCEDGIQTYKQSNKYGFVAVMVYLCANWVGYCFGHVLAKQEQSKNKSNPGFKIWVVTTASLIIYLFLRHSPFHVYLYLVLPLFYSYRFWGSFNDLWRFASCQLDKKLWVVIFLVVLDLLSISFQREKNLLNILLITWSMVILIEYRPALTQLCIWTLMTGCMAFFLTFDYIEVINYSWLELGWITLVGINLWGLRTFNDHERMKKTLHFILAVTIFSGLSAIVSDWYIKNNSFDMLRILNFFNILTLPIAVLVPYLTSRNYKPDQKILHYVIFVAMGPYFLLMSLSFEVIVYCIFGAFLSFWVRFHEQNVHQSNSNFRRIVIFMIGFQVLYQFAYYGFGNPSTLDSFTLDIGYRMVTKFNPVLMAVLQIFKFAMPFLLLAIAFQTMAKSLFGYNLKFTMNLVCLALAGCQILGMIWPEKPNYRNPKLSLSYPILAGGLYILNIIVSFIGDFCTNEY